MSSRLIAGIVAGICGTFFLGYCVYFDRKRRSDPQFKQKLLESKSLMHSFLQFRFKLRLSGSQVNRNIILLPFTLFEVSSRISLWLLRC